MSKIRRIVGAVIVVLFVVAIATLLVYKKFNLMQLTMPELKTLEFKMDPDSFREASELYKANKNATIAFTVIFSNISREDAINISRQQDALYLDNYDDAFLFISAIESAIRLSQQKEVTRMSYFSTPLSVEKLDPMLRFELLKLEYFNQSEKVLDVIITTKTKINDTQRQILIERGASLRSVVGEIITCSIRAKNIKNIIELDFVEGLDLAKIVGYYENG